MFALKKKKLYYSLFLFPSLLPSPIRYSSTSGSLYALNHRTWHRFYWIRMVLVSVTPHWPGFYPLLLISVLGRLLFLDRFFNGCLYSCSQLLFFSPLLSDDLKPSQGFSHWQHAENCQDCFMRLEFSALDPHTKLSLVMTQNIHNSYLKLNCPLLHKPALPLGTKFSSQLGTEVTL